MLNQTKTSYTPDCTIQVNIDPIPPIAGDDIGFIINSPSTGGLDKPFQTTFGGETWVQKLQLLADTVNAEYTTLRILASVDSNLETLNLVVDADYFTDQYFFTLSVIQSDNKMGITYFLPTPFRWCEADGNSYRQLPTPTKTQYGWAVNEKPALQWWNYMLNISGNMSTYVFNEVPKWTQLLKEAIALATGAVSVGDVVMRAGLTHPKAEAWFLADGRSLAVDDYPELYELLQNTFGGTVDVDFNLPDMTQSFVVGAGSPVTSKTSGYFAENTYNVGAIGGGDRHKLIANEIPDHKHRVPTLGGSASSSGDTNAKSAGGTGGSSNVYTVTDGGGDLPHENRPTYIAMAYFIKVL